MKYIADKMTNFNKRYGIRVIQGFNERKTNDSRIIR